GLGGAGGLEQPAEQQEEHQGEQDGEEQCGLVPHEALRHRLGQAHEAGHARYSRPVRLRNTSSRVAPRTPSPRSASRSARPASTPAGVRVAMVSDTPSSETSASEARAFASSMLIVPDSMEIRVGASRPRTRAAGGPDSRIFPWSMMATRSHSD